MRVSSCWILWLSIVCYNFRSSTRVAKQPTPDEEEMGEIEDSSSDSCNDPNFTVTKGAKKRREKEDNVPEDDASDEGSNPFQPVSKLKFNPIDFQNNFSRRQRGRPAKPKEKD